MAGYVLDCSVALAWVLPDENEAHAAALLARLSTERAIVPQVWSLEVSNGLLVAERRGRLKAAEVERAIGAIDALPIEVDAGTHARALHQTRELAVAHRLTSYDAAYLELALRFRLPLATLDHKLRSAGDTLAIALL